MSRQTDSSAVLNRLKIYAGVFFIYFVVVIVCQWAQDAWRNEFGGHPDEAAHYVTALMVRDYVAQGCPEPPLAFAKRYYAHYPKVAFGHWPPLFYVVLAPWMLLFDVSRLPLMIFMALLTAAFAVAVFGVGRRLMNTPLGFLAGLALLGMPMVRSHAGMLMADILTAFLCFSAAICLGAFAGQPRMKYAAGFGGLTVAAILTKGSSWALLLMPAAMALSGRWGLLRDWRLWAACTFVLLICVPWYWFTLPMQRGFENTLGLATTLRAIKFYGDNLWRVCGVGVLLLAFVGVLAVWLWKAPGCDPGSKVVWHALLALGVVVPVFHCAIAHAFDERYLLPILPPVILLAMCGAKKIVMYGGRLYCLKMVLVFFLFLSPILVPPRLFSGMGYGVAAADLMEAVPVPAGEKWLISSDARGEGMFIAAVAMRDAQRPSRVIARVSKALAESHWSGSAYESRFKDQETLRNFLRQERCAVVLIDHTVPVKRRCQHHVLLEHCLRECSTEFELWNTYPIWRDGLFFPAGLSVYKQKL